MSDTLDLFEVFFGKTKIYSPQMGRLRTLLDEAHIRYTVRKGVLGGEMLDIYDGIDGEKKILNVISDGYGREKGLLEAQGLGWDSDGYLLAEEIFAKILEYLDKYGPEGKIRYLIRHRGSADPAGTEDKKDGE